MCAQVITDQSIFSQKVSFEYTHQTSIGSLIISGCHRHWVGGTRAAELTSAATNQSSHRSPSSVNVVTSGWLPPATATTSVGFRPFA